MSLPGLGDLTCASPRLSYYGGPVIANPLLVPVFWNADVNPTSVTEIPRFLADITQSDYWYLLSEYATDTPAIGDKGGLLQSVGAGSATAGITLKPTKCPEGSPAGCTLTDADLQAELARQINQDVLPVPSVAYDGQMRTIYMVYFPAGVTLADASIGTSCVDFCAYHNAATVHLASRQQNLLYDALMDTYSGGCSIGCGASTTGLGNLTSTSVHELAETVTDPNVGFVTGNQYAWPAAWADNDHYCGEIADICAAGNNYPIMVSGRTWEVQPLWSNKLRNCAITGVYPSLQIEAPSAVLSGGPFLFSVTVINPSPGHSIDTAFSGTLSLSSSDPSASIIAPLPFDVGGSGIAQADATLRTAGLQSITASGSDPRIAGSATVNVNISTTVTVRTVPPGLSFSVDGKTYIAAQSFTWNVGSPHALSTQRVQAPTPGTVDIFTLWSDGGSASHGVAAASENAVYIAAFASSYRLSASPSPLGAGAVSTDGNGWYAAGARVAIRALPNKGYEFAGWVGPVEDSATATTHVAMNGPVTVTAVFVEAAASRLPPLSTLPPRARRPD
ncbi:MAG TPA: hypothetical protein VGL22_16205 [Terracidiphilus sp.]